MAPDSSLEQQVTSKVRWRIIPLLFGLYVISYLDRANIGYAALQMNAELGLSTQAYGFAAGIFFIGYFLFEVPSNMALSRYGSRLWISRILVSWGVIAALCAFVQTPMQLYVLRFLLGVAEAGFFPGIIIYMTYWFRAKDQATSVALFTAAIPVSYLIGAPLSTWIMDHVTWLGMSGWRWMILLEAVPALLGGVACYTLLTDRPEQATWLREHEKRWLVGELASDNAQRDHIRKLNTLQAITDPKVLLLALIYFVYQAGSLGVGYWMPQIIRDLSTKVSNFEIGLLAMIPYGIATLAMILWSRHSDRTGERQWHAAIPLLVATVALGAAGFMTTTFASLTLISLALSGLYAFKSPFWSLPGLFLTRSTAAISIAAINSIGNLGGFLGPYLIGFVRQLTGQQLGGLLFLSLLLLIAFVLTARVRLSPGPARTA